MYDDSSSYASEPQSRSFIYKDSPSKEETKTTQSNHLKKPKIGFGKAESFIQPQQTLSGQKNQVTPIETIGEDESEISILLNTIGQKDTKPEV